LGLEAEKRSEIKFPLGWTSLAYPYSPKSGSSFEDYQITQPRDSTLLIAGF